MSSLTIAEKSHLEEYLQMQSGYVLFFSDKTFSAFVMDAVGKDIDNLIYQKKGRSKADKLRAFWNLEPNHIVGTLISAFIDHQEAKEQDSRPNPRAEHCRQIAVRLLSSNYTDALMAIPKIRDSANLYTQIQRLNESVTRDPALAIGSAKELVETVCKTILNEHSIKFTNNTEFTQLTRETFKVLKLVKEEVTDAKVGADQYRQMLSNLGSICKNLAEIRNNYGTGHGRPANHVGLDIRHARLAVGVATTLAQFLFETHEQQLKNPNSTQHME